VTEFELKCQVPAASLRAVRAAMKSARAPLKTVSLVGSYVDTESRALARAGLVWRLRREGRRWVQALKAAGPHALERFEHEVPRPNAAFDDTAHAGTPAGERLAAVLQQASADGEALHERLRTQVRRSVRRVRTRGAVVEIALDEGRIVAGARSTPVREIEFELVSGSPQALLDLAQRWILRHGLWIDPHTKSERGDHLADARPFPPVRKSRMPETAREADAVAAFAGVLEECLAQMLRNAAGLLGGVPAQRAEHVHQLRVGIRRLRSALRSFRGWVSAPPAGLVEGLKALFDALGRARDADVLDAGVQRELAAAGAPAIAALPSAAPVDPVALLAGPATQGLWCRALGWRIGMPAAGGASAAQVPASSLASSPEPAAGARPFAERAARRLARWHERLAADAKAFERFDEAAVHDLRKRIKRQRYATEFFAPVLRRAPQAAYLQALGEVQERMGELNDLFVARSLYEAAARRDPGAWFALGWLAARIAERRARVVPALARLARTPVPPARRLR
jgi:inorganic triphosphatase YgiF